MVTGGIRRKEVAEDALAGAGEFNVKMLGIARALAFRPQLANDWQNNQNPDVELPEINWKKKALGSLAVMAITKAQLARLAVCKAPKLALNPVFALIIDQVKTKWRTRRYKAWRRTEK